VLSPVLSPLHPLPKLVICCLWLTASILIFNATFQLLAIAAVAAALIVLERRSPLTVIALMVPFGLFGFGFLTTSLLFRQESDIALRMASETPFGSSALSAGLVLFLRAVASGMVSALFVLTTDPGALVKAMMVSWRLSPRLGYSLFSALHLTRDMASEAQQMRMARAVRRGRPPRRIPGPLETASLVVPLLAYAIRRASRTAIAMEARGLGSAAARTVFAAPRYRPADLVFAVSAVLLLVVMVAASGLLPNTLSKIVSTCLKW
jgi:energy-coupling factor transport system permease protein